MTPHIFLYTLAGSVLLLLVMIGLYFSTIDPGTGLHTFNLIAMTNPENVSTGLFAQIGSTARMLAACPTHMVRTAQRRNCMVS